MRRGVIAIIVLTAALGGAVPAGAQELNAPSGNSGVDEYLETIPQAGGNRPANRDLGNAPLSAALRQRLEREGADGLAAADLAERSGPLDASDGQAGASPDGDGGLLGPIARAAGGSGDGMGVWLAILLGMTVAAALGTVLMRRRRADLN